MLETVNVGVQSIDSYAGAERGRELVRERFLLPRLIADELRLYGDLLGTPQKPLVAAQAGLAGEKRDPVCGMRLAPDEGISYEYAGHLYHFCSESCREQFRQTPEYFLRAVACP